MVLLQQVKFEKVKNDTAGVQETDSDSPLTEDKEEVLTHQPSQQQDSISYFSNGMDQQLCGYVAKQVDSPKSTGLPLVLFYFFFFLVKCSKIFYTTIKGFET